MRSRNDAASIVYAPGSHSGATGETIFNYIASNFLEGDVYEDRLVDPATLSTGMHTIRCFVADRFNNVSSRDLLIEVVRK